MILAPQWEKVPPASFQFIFEPHRIECLKKPGLLSARQSLQAANSDVLRLRHMLHVHGRSRRAGGLDLGTNVSPQGRGAVTKRRFSGKSIREAGGSEDAANVRGPTHAGVNKLTGTRARPPHLWCHVLLLMLKPAKSKVLTKISSRRDPALKPPDNTCACFSPGDAIAVEGNRRRMGGTGPSCLQQALSCGRGEGTLNRIGIRGGLDSLGGAGASL